MSIRAHLALGLAALSIAAGGCYRPQGALMPSSGAAYTYFSYEMAPKTIKVYDLRTGESIFALDIPAGKQLTMEFKEGAGDDPVYTPDVLRYEIMDMGTTTGKLTNSMSVPGSGNRRVEVEIRKGVEFRAATDERMLRVDEIGDRPDWWSPRGGEMPRDPNGLENYDK